MYLKQYNEFIAEEYGWIADATKNKGGLHKDLNIPMDKKIPMSLINKKIAELKKKGDLSTAEKKTLKRLYLAKTLKNM